MESTVVDYTETETESGKSGRSAGDDLMGLANTGDGGYHPKAASASPDTAADNTTPSHPQPVTERLTTRDAASPSGLVSCLARCGPSHAHLTIPFPLALRAADSTVARPDPAPMLVLVLAIHRPMGGR